MGDAVSHKETCDVMSCGRSRLITLLKRADERACRVNAASVGLSSASFVFHQRLFCTASLRSCEVWVSRDLVYLSKMLSTETVVKE